MTAYTNNRSERASPKGIRKHALLHTAVRLYRSLDIRGTSYPENLSNNRYFFRILSVTQNSPKYCLKRMRVWESMAGKAARKAMTGKSIHWKSILR